MSVYPLVQHIGNSITIRDGFKLENIPSIITSLEDVLKDNPSIIDKQDDYSLNVCRVVGVNVYFMLQAGNVYDGSNDYYWFRITPDGATIFWHDNPINSFTDTEIILVRFGLLFGLRLCRGFGIIS